MRDLNKIMLQELKPNVLMEKTFIECLCAYKLLKQTGQIETNEDIIYILYSGRQYAKRGHYTTTSQGVLGQSIS